MHTVLLSCMESTLHNDDSISSSVFHLQTTRMKDLHSAQSALDLQDRLLWSKLMSHRADLHGLWRGEPFRCFPVGGESG